MIQKASHAGARTRRRTGFWPAVVMGGLALLAADAAVASDMLTLGDAISRALADGAGARIARLETEQADNAFDEKRAGYLPQVGLTSEAGWSNRYDETFLALQPDGSVNQYGIATLAPDRAWLNFYVSQVLLDLKQWHEIEREELAAEAAEVAEVRSRDDVAHEITLRYARLVNLERKLELAAEQLEEASQLEQRAEALFEAGRLIEVDRDLARLHATDAELASRVLEQEMRAARAELWIAIGEDEALRLPIDPSSLPVIDPRDAAYGAVEAVGTSPELRILDLRRRMDEASVDAAKAGRLPTMKFVSGYSHYGPKRYDAYRDEIWVGVDLSVPIFDGFRSENAIKGAQRGVEIARLRYDRTLRQKRARVRELIQRLETAQSRLELAQQRAAAAEEQVRLADLNLRAERGDLGSAVAARERRMQLASEAIDLEYEQVEIWADLQRELGRLSFQILGPVASAAATPTP